MPDATNSSGLNQSGLIALLQQLGLGQYANQALGNGKTSADPLHGFGQTVGGQPAQYDPGTLNLSNAGKQGGFSDQELMAPPGGPVDAQTALGLWSGRTHLSDLNNARTAFNQNQADSIAKLLNGLNQPPQAPPINLATQLNNKPPLNVAPVVNSPSGAYIDPTKSFLPGMGPSTAVPATGSLPSLSTPASAPNALAATQQMINQQNALPTAPVASSPVMQDPIKIMPVNLADQVQAGMAPQSAIIAAGGPLQASAGSGIAPGSLPPPSSVQTQPMMRSYSPPAPLTTIMPSGHAGQSGYAATTTSVPGGVAAAGGQGYLPASANTGAISGPTVVPGAAGGFSTDPNTASANQPTDSAAAGGAGMNPQIAGTIASGISKIGAALAPKTITNDAQTRINLNALPRPITFSPPMLTGR